MREILIDMDTLTEGYHAALSALNKYGEITDCNDWNTTQKEICATIVIKHPLQEPMISKCFIGGPEELQQYVMEMLDGILDFEIDRGKWEYTYHDRMIRYPGNDGYLIDQISFVENELRRNPSSRRAVIMIRSKDDIGSEDPACMQHIQYFIRDNQLHCKVLFRSNDGPKASFMNMFALIMLQKRIADNLGLEVGTYTHRANSYHCYEKDFDKLASYAERINSESLEDLSYDYEDDWKEMMEESIPKILNQVEELKRR